MNTMTTTRPVVETVRMAPNNIDAEEAYIGSLLIDSEMIDRTCGMLDSSDFFIVKNGWVFSVIMDIHLSGAPIDFLTVCNELERRGQFAEAGGAPFLSHLLNATPTAMHAYGYAEIIKEAAVKRKLLGIANDAAVGAHNGCAPVDVIEKLQRELNLLKLRVAPEPEKENELKLVPELPADVRVDCDWTGAGSFLNGYLHHALCVSPMTPEAFHESAALWLIGVAIARRLKASLDFGEVYPNLYIGWIAPSTLWHKTTALNIARRIVYRAFPHLMSPQDTTLEGLISDWSGKEPENLATLPESDQGIWRASRNFSAQRGLIIDELSGFLAGTGRDYNAGLIEVFLKLYDCTERLDRSTRGQGLIIVKNAYLSFIGASTPMAMYQHMINDRLWADGWWARYALLVPDRDRPEYFKPSESTEPTDLIDALKALNAKLPTATWPDAVEARSVIFVPDALEAIDRYFKCVGHDMITDSLDYRLWAVYGRMTEKLVKVSVLLATIDWAQQDSSSNVPTVTMAHMARAMVIVENWRAISHRVIEQTMMSEGNRFLQRVLHCIMSAGERGMTFRDMYKSMRDRQPYEIRDALNQLMQACEIEEVALGPGKRGGPGSVRYRLARGR